MDESQGSLVKVIIKQKTTNNGLFFKQLILNKLVIHKLNIQMNSYELIEKRKQHF